MKNRKTYIVFVIFFLALSSLLHFRKEATPDFTFVERIEGSNTSSEWQNAKVTIQGMLTELQKKSGQPKTKLKLALAYINESRITGKHAYYDAAALSLLHRIPQADKNYFDVKCAIATIQLSQHHFSEALQTGNLLIQQNPHSAFAFGVLTDAHLESGNYEAAIKAADQMVALRPDIRSYARVAYLREVTGDILGAIEIMKMAVAAGIPGLEQTEWCRYQLGKLFESVGDIESANDIYVQSLQIRKNYPYALAGLASIATHKQNYSDAIRLYTQAKSFTDDYSFTENLYELYTLAKQPTNAAQAQVECLKMLGANSGDESENFMVIMLIKNWLSFIAS
ncbi:MAG: tetratricopeptide repeat protein [Bacteroidetes bacterium]|nr:tetratricopeptide repeat protein [Bacteroidota bacterium]